MILWTLLVCVVAQAGDPPPPPAAEEAPPEEHYEVIEQQIDYGMEQVAEVKKANDALRCFLLDKKAVDEDAPDVPPGWVQPEYEDYEAEGAPCSFIPARRAEEERLAAEEAARRAEEAARRAAEAAEALDTAPEPPAEVR